LPKTYAIGKSESEDRQCLEMCGVREKCEDGEVGDDGREIGRRGRWTGGELGR